MSAGTTWVISDLAPDERSYIVSIQCGPDRVFTPKDPTAYALAVIRACEYARYDAAVLAQMTKIAGGDEGLAAGVIAALRDDRPPVDDVATAPLVYSPIVSARNRSPQVLVHLDGEPYTQWTPAEATGHAMHVLSAAAVVEIDAAYFRYLTGMLEVPSGTARGAIDDLRNWRADC